LLPFLTAADLVIAHNAQFDIRKLNGTLSHFGIPCPSFPTLCTCKTAKRAWPELPNHKLSTVAGHIGHHFCHHNALDDAEAAGTCARGNHQRTRRGMGPRIGLFQRIKWISLVPLTSDCPQSLSYRSNMNLLQDRSMTKNLEQGTRSPRRRELSGEHTRPRLRESATRRSSFQHEPFAQNPAAKNPSMSC
jgi:DNA polymerase III epsilon subunit-like protein